VVRIKKDIMEFFSLWQIILTLIYVLPYRKRLWSLYLINLNTWNCKIFKLLY